MDGILAVNDKHKSRSYTAFFDLDNTLINANSGKLLVKFAHKSKMMTGGDLLRALWLTFLFRTNLRDTEKIISDMLGRVAGVPEKILQELASGLFDQHLSAMITPDARSELLFHKEKKAKLVILSSSLSPVCRKVADYLQFDGIICTDPEVRNGYLTGRSVGPVCYGPEKVKRLTEYCQKNNTTPEDSWYYGDSVSDFPVLNIVGHPVCINPDKKLKRIAEKKGWKTKYWR